LNLVEFLELLVDEDIEVDLIIILQKRDDSLELSLEIILSIFDLMLRLQETEELRVLH